MKKAKHVVIPYLEHVISNWGETGPVFHNALILRYKDSLVYDLFEQPESSEAEAKITATRTKLAELLSASNYFTADTILPQFPLHCLYEERALLLGSLGKHKEALALYLFQVTFWLLFLRRQHFFMYLN